MANQKQFDLENFKPPNISAKLVRNIVIILLLLFFFFSSWFTISPFDVAIFILMGLIVVFLFLAVYIFGRRDL